uniref:Toll-like receptor 1 n=2 Tax=Gouania willdenowi TaxID=441366 RepID=A0A8C5GBA9_GOUWI
MRGTTTDLSHQNLTLVPADIPKDTQYLNLSHNFIQSLNGDEFAGLSKLCLLEITHCGLQEVSPSVFIHTPQLKVLNISNNMLSFIPELSLQELRVLDLDHNPYASYQLPASFQTLTKLDTLVLGSRVARTLDLHTFEPLRNLSLHHLVLGAGTTWLKYAPGSLAKLKSLQKFSLRVTFCKDFRIFENILVDINVTRAKFLKFVRVVPDRCEVCSDPFRPLRAMPSIQTLVIENTWINSSFMEMFLKNVWLSSIQTLSFLNMTYNEDTPNGFQFHTPNHSFSLSSITFNVINHYQYRYPTINMSFDAISGLTYLKFSGTGMNILPCRVLSDLPTLETMDLSDNLLSETGFWWFRCSLTSIFPRLRSLSLSKNRFSSLSTISMRMQQMQTVEVLDLSSNSISLDGPCSWPAQLTELRLANNNLGNAIFRCLSPHLKKIDLSKTGITFLTQDLSLLPRLTHLWLSSNSIQVIPSNLQLPTLLSLHVDQNSITSISSEAFVGFPRLQILQAGLNPFDCSCDSFWFITAFNKSQLLDWPYHYSCNSPPELSGRPLSTYRPSRMSCEAGLQAAVALPLFVSIVVVLGLVFYKYDGLWYTKMLWVWIRVRRRGAKRSHLLTNASYNYHAFISYSHHDSHWVDSQLTPSLETSGFSLCVHERDFVPGEWIIDNIINCVESSYKTLFVLSKHFVQSEWCNYELFFAQHRAVSVQRDSLVFILLEPIPADSLPKKFLRLRTLLRQQTYLEWPDEARKQQVFWASLRSMLQMGDKSVLKMKDVAQSISETMALVSNSHE